VPITAVFRVHNRATARRSCESCGLRRTAIQSNLQRQAESGIDSQRRLWAVLRCTLASFGVQEDGCELTLERWTAVGLEERRDRKTRRTFKMAHLCLRLMASGIPANSALRFSISGKTAASCSTNNIQSRRHFPRREREFPVGHTFAITRKFLAASGDQSLQCMERMRPIDLDPRDRSHGFDARPTSSCSITEGLVFFARFPSGALIDTVNCMM